MVDSNSEIKKRKRYVSQVRTISGIFLCCLISNYPAIAQISPDNTLATPTQVLPGTQPGLDFQIQGGTQVGNNLFHSFQQFSVPTGGSANFNNLTSIQNIISRVTGGLASSIDGLIKTNGNANLFLINPNGIVFGPNASLNVGGSFIATTANSLKLSNGDEFSTTNPKTPLLTISVPIGLQFNNIPTSIINRSQYTGGENPLNAQNKPVGLQGSSNTTLALLGGGVVGDSGNITVPGGQIVLGSVGENTFVSLTPTSQGFAFSYAGVNNFRDVQLNGSSIDVTGSTEGKIQIQGQKVKIQDSTVAAETRDASKGGDLFITADDLQVTDLSLVGTESKGLGQGGDITINTNTLTVSNGAQVVANASAGGAGGNITIKARDSIDLAGEGEFSGDVYTSRLSVETSGSGKAGVVDIATANLTIRDGARILASTSANGTAGNVIINATTADLKGMSVNQNSGIFSQVEKDATGQGGNISFYGEKLNIQDGAQISTSTLGSGNAGSIFVEAGNWVHIIGQESSLSGSGLFAQVNENNATGNGGNVFIKTNNLMLQGATAFISASTSGVGAGGNVDIKTQDLVVQDGGQIQAATIGLAPGGKLNVTANTIQLKGTAIDQSPGGLFTSTKGDALAGNLTIKTSNLFILDGARVSASSSGAGQGGNISIDSDNQVELIGTSADGTTHSGLFVQATGNGKAGNIQLQSRSLLLDQNAEISAETASDDGGDISLKVADILNMRRNSLISASAGATSGQGNGGNININTKFLLAGTSENSDITANAFKGRGGKIRITAQGIFGIEFRNQLTPLSDITVSSTYGTNGIVQFYNVDDQPIQGFTNLPTTVIDVSNAIAQGCKANRNQAANRFIVVGRGGLPASPESILGGDFILEDLRTIPLPRKTKIGSNVSPTITNSASSTFVEAQKILANPQGGIFLTTQTPTNTNPNFWLSSDCYVP
ncbi:S-layer family protein [Nostoc sp. FACHB-152]|uniref:two-partner secretion domain-containing protein n=1 Tax=unclassified Nostoc TaxID=2593658 RepID=UPI00168705C2|nr:MULTISPECIES: filamentous hemagglutinin N-terminal domain-containing protein [unclassified Nostoc]MBD2446992.1 S-layer family protein [Nostoc sp. FACHB-152]MBD2467671.1 S-layer family protein [Nostoc sp. FACHB-145]